MLYTNTNLKKKGGRGKYYLDGFGSKVSKEVEWIQVDPGPPVYI